MREYENEAIEMLKRKRFIENACSKLEREIAFSEEHIGLLEKLNDLSVKEQDIRKTMKEKLFDCHSRLLTLKEELETIERGYAFLTPYQRDLLEVFFVTGETKCADTIMERYPIEHSKVYRDRKKAITLFTMAAFGLTDQP